MIGWSMQIFFIYLFIDLDRMQSCLGTRLDPVRKIWLAGMGIPLIFADPTYQIPDTGLVDGGIQGLFLFTWTARLITVV